MAISNSSKEPLTTFGVLTDVQYADCDNLPASYDPSKLRYYRGSLDQVDIAFKHWEASRKVQFVLQLGDIIDGRSKQCPGGSYIALHKTLAHFEKHSSIPTFHTVGNHELYNFNREKLAQLFYESVMKFKISPEIFSPENPTKGESSPLANSILYYKFCPTPTLKCISLDCFDVSVLGYSENHPKYRKAAEILTSKHGHDIFNDWDCDGDLKGLDIRFQQMNGAIGVEQLKWLDSELAESEELKQKVIVFGHVSISPESTDASCILWNYDEVMNIFHKYNCVIAYFSGHSHVNGYAVDSHGISYVVFTGIIETPPTTSAFATVSVYEDHLYICGHGIEQSYSIPVKEKGADSETVVENDIGTTPAVVRVKV